MDSLLPQSFAVSKHQPKALVFFFSLTFSFLLSFTLSFHIHTPMYSILYEFSSRPFAFSFMFLWLLHVILHPSTHPFSHLHLPTAIHFHVTDSTCFTIHFHPLLPIPRPLPRSSFHHIRTMGYKIAPRFREQVCLHGHYPATVGQPKTGHRVWWCLIQPGESLTKCDHKSLSKPCRKAHSLSSFSKAWQMAEESVI